MVYTSPTIAPLADMARGERSGRILCQNCKPRHKRRIVVVT
jgi:hypothetical protein